MTLWLFKEEPDHYSFSDLERDGKTIWYGVTNNLALKNLRQVKKGDRILFYHTGKEKAIVGEMRAVADATDEKFASVEVEAVRPLPKPVTLEQVKKDKLLSSWDLVRLPRLSIMPVTQAQWKRVAELSM